MISILSNIVILHVFRAFIFIRSPRHGVGLQCVNAQWAQDSGALSFIGLIFQSFKILHYIDVYKMHNANH